MPKLLATAFVFGKALFPAETPEAERQKTLAPFFNPPPGHLVEVDSYDQQNSKRPPLQRRGFIMITPPKDRCFIIRKHRDLPDERVCSKTQLSFEIRSLDEAGQVVWDISTGMDDFGTKLVWPTPHRLAQIVAIGEMEKSMGTYVPTLNCRAEVAEGRRNIYIDLMDGTKWAITFPPQDLLANQPEPLPNLYLQKGGTNPFVKGAEGQASPDTAGGHGAASGNPAAASDEHPAANQPPNQTTPDAAPEGHGEGQKVALVSQKKEDKEAHRFYVPERNSFVMDSANFRVDDSPSGMNGTCRYKLKGAPKDPQSGIIECIRTDRYDVVLTHLPCSATLLQPGTAR